MSTNKKISSLIEQQFPEFIRTDGPNFVAFLEGYYEWMEQSGRMVDASKNVLAYRDIDNTLDQYVQYFKDEFMVTLPQTHLANNATVIKNVINFHRAKGSEKSYQFLFRIVYDQDVDFYYPGQDILRASDGRWVLDKTLRVEKPADPDAIFSMSGHELTGATSGATAVVEAVVKTIVNGLNVYDLTLKSINGTFILDEVVETTNAITATTTGILVEQSGRFVGTKGFLSWDKFLQDNYYYQEYSYVLKTNEFVDRYRDVVKKSVHPSGTILFGEVNFTDTLAASVSLTDSETGLEVETAAITQLADRFTANTIADQSFGLELILDDQSLVAAATDQYDTYWLKLDGTIDISNSGNTVGQIAANTLLQMQATQLIELVGGNTLVIGTGTNFTVVDPTSNVFVRDSGTPGTQADQLYAVDEKFSNTLMTIDKSYETPDISGGELLWQNPSFRYLRLDVTETANSAAALVHIGRFRVLVNSTEHPQANMVSASSPSPYVITAKNEHPGRPVWRMFDETLVSETDGGQSGVGQGVPWWVQIDLGSGGNLSRSEISGISITTGVSGMKQYAPISFMLSGSNDADFTNGGITLLTVNSANNMTVNETRTYDIDL